MAVEGGALQIGTGHNVWSAKPIWSAPPSCEKVRLRPIGGALDFQDHLQRRSHHAEFAFVRFLKFARIISLHHCWRYRLSRSKVSRWVLAINVKKGYLNW